MSLEYSHSEHKFLSVDPLNKKALLRMSTKTLNFLRIVDVVLLFFIFVFKFFDKSYKEFLVHLIAEPEQSEKIWYGVNDKVSMGEYGKESG